MSQPDDFAVFYAQFNEAISAGDQDALRRVLPPGIDEEHFAFLWEMNQGFAAEGGSADITVDGDYACVRLGSEDDEDGTFNREFWWLEKGWVCYDPAEDD